jgi:SAM-dependent methyltransferase
MAEQGVYATPRVVTDLRDCYFYHTIDIPGHGTVNGEWDLRGGLDRYLGNTDFRGKKVLDVGAATGFLSFGMEQRGASVTSYDLSPEHDWDIVPFEGHDNEEKRRARREHIGRLNNGYWLCHRAFQSRARVVYGTVYDMPRQMEPVDIAVFGSILLHLRDPFLALQNAARYARESMVVVDGVPRRYMYMRMLDRLGLPIQILAPDPRKGAPSDGWWFLTPSIVRQYLGILGFRKTTTTYSRPLFEGSRRTVFTIVAHR